VKGRDSKIVDPFTITDKEIGIEYMQKIVKLILKIKKEYSYDETTTYCF